MIRINLLKSLQTPVMETEPIPGRTEQIESVDLDGFAEERSGNGRLWILIPVILVISAGIGIYLAMHRSHTETRMEKSESNPVTKSVPTPAVTTPPPDSVKPVVNTTANNAEDPDPSRRIAFQYFAGTRLLQDLQTAAAQGVGFTRIMFTPPDEFYVHGVASTEEDLRHFKTALMALPEAALQQDQVLRVGPGGVAREFHFSGRIHYENMGMASTENRVLVSDQVAMTLKEFMNATHALGIELEPIQLQDSSVSEGLTRFLYHTEASCDYARLQSLLDRLQRKKSHVGFQRVSLEAQGNEKMIASLDLLVYTR